MPKSRRLRKWLERQAGVVGFAWPKVIPVKTKLKAIKKREILFFTGSLSLLRARNGR
jgi:hypothetical protein